MRKRNRCREYRVFNAKIMDLSLIDALKLKRNWYDSYLIMLSENKYFNLIYMYV